MAGRVLCLLAFVAAAAAAKPESRLIGGIPIYINEAPHVVSLKYTYPGIGYNIQRCVGSLISSWHVITSAYCFTGAYIGNFYAQAGSEDSITGGISQAAANVVTHPQYSSRPRTNDIAVLYVQSPFPIGIYIDVLYLPAAGYGYPAGTELKVAGWGFNAVDGEAVPYLTAIDVTTIPQSECARTFAGSNDVQIDGNVFCAIGYYGQGLCTGNSGAAAALSSTLIGISSFYQGCDTYYPDVYTNVPQYTEWILSVTSSDGGSPRATA